MAYVLLALGRWNDRAALCRTARQAIWTQLSHFERLGPLCHSSPASRPSGRQISLCVLVPPRPHGRTQLPVHLPLPSLCPEKMTEKFTFTEGHRLINGVEWNKRGLCSLARRGPNPRGALSELRQVTCFLTVSRVG